MSRDLLNRPSIGRRFPPFGGGRSAGLILVIILSFAVFIVSIKNLYYDYRRSNPSHIYMVKICSVPIFGAEAGNPDSVGRQAFDRIIAEKQAQVEDLFPDNNEDDDLGRWIIVKSSDDISSDLLGITEDVEGVEDGSAVYSTQTDVGYRYLDYLEQESGYRNTWNYEYAFGNVRNDKTWGIRLPKVKEALAVLKPIRQVKVGVVDTGLDLKHPAFAGKLAVGWNFAGGDPQDPSNRAANEMHATHVAGTIVANQSADGFFGIANSVATVIPVRVLDESGSGTVINVSRGVVFAADNGANVINMSLGAPSYSRALHDAVKHAVNKRKAVVVCAKGNANSDREFYPAGFPEVIRVTATALKEDGSEERAYFSNYGANSTCAAPGHYIYSALPEGKYGFASGTSMACPHAAACAAVILSLGHFRPEDVKSIMETRGDTLKTDKPIGKRINLLNFVEKAKHDLIPLLEIKNHPYGVCCVNAGIISRDAVNVGPRSTTTIHQDKDSYRWSYFNRYNRFSCTFGISNQGFDFDYDVDRFTLIP